MELVEAIVLAVLAASTPLLIAASGELVTERSGVLNLGVEGMMIVGAACGFGGAWLTGSIFIGGEQAQIAMKIPLDVTKVFQGILLFYVLACDSLILYRFRLIFASRQAPTEQVTSGQVTSGTG